jgi:hypothetical protein
MRSPWERYQSRERQIQRKAVFAARKEARRAAQCRSARAFNIAHPDLHRQANARYYAANRAEISERRAARRDERAIYNTAYFAKQKATMGWLAAVLVLTQPRRRSSCS